MFEYLKSLGNVLRLLVVIGLTKAAGLTRSVVDEIQAAAHRIRRTLAWTAALMVVVPSIIFVLGLMSLEQWLFGLAGLLFALGTAIVLFAFVPLAVLLELVLTPLSWVPDTFGRKLTQRYLSTIVAILLVESVMTLYCTVMPVAHQPTILVANAVALLIIVLLSYHSPVLIGGLLRFFGFFAAVGVIIVTSLSLTFPQTAAQLKSEFRSIDAELGKGIISQIREMIERPAPKLNPKPVEQSAVKPADSARPFLPAVGNEPVTKGPTPHGIVTLPLQFNVETRSIWSSASVNCESGDTIQILVDGNLTFNSKWLSKRPSHSFVCGPDGGWPSLFTEEAYRRCDFPSGGKIFNAIARIVDLDYVGRSVVVRQLEHKSDRSPIYPVGSHGSFVAPMRGTVFVGMNHPEWGHWMDFLGWVDEEGNAPLNWGGEGQYTFRTFRKPAVVHTG